MARGAIPNEELAARVHSAALHLLRRLAQEDRATGVSAPRLSALSVLVFGGPRTIGALAAIEGVTPPTMTRLVAAMVADGLLDRLEDPADRRVVRVQASGSGRSLLLAGRDRRVQTLAAMLLQLTPKEGRRLASSAATIERILEDGTSATRRSAAGQEGAGPRASDAGRDPAPVRPLARRRPPGRDRT